jgi:hypothetical protein
MTTPDVPDEPEGQDQAEVFDEANITPDGRNIATSDMQRDLFDATSVDEDADEALEPADDFDPDAMDEAEYEEVVLADEDLDEPRSFASDHPDRLADDDEQPDDYEAGDSGVAASGDVEEDLAERIDRPRQRRPDGARDDR